MKHTLLIMCTTMLVNSHANAVQKTAWVSERLWKLSKCPERARGPHWGSLLWLHSSSKPPQEPSREMLVVLALLLVDNCPPHTWLSLGWGEVTNRLTKWTRLPPEGGYFWSVLSNICRLEQGGVQAAQEKVCAAVTKLQIKLRTAVS